MWSRGQVGQVVGLSSRRRGFDPRRDYHIMGYGVTVAHWTLTPKVIVRINLSQPYALVAQL